MANSQLNDSRITDFMHQLADAAKKITSNYFRQDIQVQQKADQTPVTRADLETEYKLRELVNRTFPEHGFFGEETGSSDLHAEFTWIIDPIDGTKNYTIGVPIFGTLIALLREGVPVAGLLDMPVLEQRWLGLQGQATKLNGRVCGTSNCSKLSDAIIHATTPDMFDKHQAQQFDRLSAHCRFRLFGKDCYAYGLLASGFLQLIMEADLKVFDILPLVPIVQGAGAVISDWNGQAISLQNHRKVLVACNETLQQQALTIINEQIP